MFRFTELKQIQIEITNRCQASCPMCSRNIHGGIENPNLQLSDWTYDDFVKIFNADVLNQIEKVTFCGDFGDPIINNDLMRMCEYLKDTNIFVTINTNGSARKPEFWSKLATVLPKNHTVEFALDGLEDTHSLHRIGTDSNTILSNPVIMI